MDRLDSAQNTPQDAHKIDDEIIEDNDPATDEGAPDAQSTFNAQPVTDDHPEQEPEKPRHSL